METSKIGRKVLEIAPGCCSNKTAPQVGSRNQVPEQRPKVSTVSLSGLHAEMEALELASILLYLSFPIVTVSIASS